MPVRAEHWMYACNDYSINIICNRHFDPTADFSQYCKTTIKKFTIKKFLSGYTIKIKLKNRIIRHVTVFCNVDVRNYDVQAHFHYNYQVNYDKLLKSY